MLSQLALLNHMEYLVKTFSTLMDNLQLLKKVALESVLSL